MGVITQAGDVVQIPYLEHVEEFPKVGTISLDNNNLII